MFFLYVDESGDTGLTGSPTDYFILSGLVFHELNWLSLLDSIISFRQYLKTNYRLKLREEIHARDFLHTPGELSRIPKSRRFNILRDVINFEAQLTEINVINVVVDKTSKPPGYDVFENGWRTLFQRFHNTMSSHNFPGPQNAVDYGITIVDETMVKKLQGLLRKMRRYNPVPNLGRPGYRDIQVRTITEDPVHRKSSHSYLVQLSDVNAFFLYQRIKPNAYVRKKGMRNYFNKLLPVLCTVASRTDPYGIVWL